MEVLLVVRVIRTRALPLVPTPPARPVAVRSRGRGDARTGVEGPLGGLFAIVLPVWTQHDVHWTDVRVFVMLCM